MKYWLSHLPLEVWVDVFRYPGISREQLGRYVDRIGNYKFAEYLQFYLHDWGKRTLENWLSFEENGMNVFVPYNWPFNRYPGLPLAPMPANIKCFERITIHHFDAQTVNFFRQIRALLSDVNLKISINEISFTNNNISSNNMINLRVILANLRTILTNMVPLLDGIHSFSLDVCALPTVRQCFGGDKLTKIKRLEIIHFDVKQEPMDVMTRQTTVNFLVDWLNSSEQNDGPKVCDAMISRGYAFGQQISAAIREQFFAAGTRCTFAMILSLGWRQFADEYEYHLENGVGEELHCVQIGSESGDVQITRHRKNRGKELQEWIEANAKTGCRQIRISDPTIGLIDGMDAPEDEGLQPSTSKKARIS